MMKYLKLINVFYRRNLAKNVLMVALMNITNIVVSIFIMFFGIKNSIIPTLSQSYLEHLSVNVSAYQSMVTNNDLIKVRIYKRPSIETLSNVSQYTGDFSIFPDYSPFLYMGKYQVFDKEVKTPTIVIYEGSKEAIGINTLFFKQLQKEVQIVEDNINIEMNLHFSLVIEEEVKEYSINQNMRVTFIYKEPSFLATPKLYLPQEYINEQIGNLSLNTTTTFANFLFNLSDDHDYTNYRYLIHFSSLSQKQEFVKIASQTSEENEGLEVISDEINKVKSFEALYSYISILVVIFLVFIIIACVVIYVVIGHTSLLSNLKQMALVAILGAQKSDLYSYYLVIIIWNFLLGLLSAVSLPYLITLFEQALKMVMNISISISINYSWLIWLYGGNFLVLLFITSFIFMINMRRPLLYLLIDA